GPQLEPERGDVRCPARGRRPLHDRLDERRPALLVRAPERPAAQRAVQPRDQRLHAGADLTPAGSRAGARGQGPLRPALAGRAHARAFHGHRHSLVHLRPAAAHAVRAGIPRAHEGHEPHVARDVGRDLRARRAPRVTLAQVHSGFFGTPLQGFGIVGCDGGIGFGTEGGLCDSAWLWRVEPRPSPPGFGVVRCLHPHISWMFAGEDVVSLFPETQLFTDCWAPKMPPASVMSAELESPDVPLFSNVLPEILLPDSWK